MRKTKTTRLIAVFLSLMMFGTSFGISAAADNTGATSVEGDTSTFSYDIDDVRDLLNAEEYSEYKARNAEVPRARKAIKIDAVDGYNKEESTAVVKVVGDALLAPEDGIVAWDVTIPSTAKYAIDIEYSFLNEEEGGKAASIERRFRIDDEYPFKSARYLSITKVWRDRYKADEVTGEPVKHDLNGNDIRPEKYIDNSEFHVYTFMDSTGYEVEPFEFVFEKGEHTISLEATREAMLIKSITLYPYKDVVGYEEYLKDEWKPADSSAAPIILQAEATDCTSAKTIYPQNDRTSALTQPQDPSLSKLNALGGTKWQTVGQWIEYRFTPTATGLYEIVPRFKQSDLNGMYTSRRLYIYGGDYNGVPFTEANYLQFNYSDTWMTAPLNDGTTEFQFYFEEGVEYTIRFEVVLGGMSEIIGRVQSALTSINSDYLKILQITGADPDEYRDYNFNKLIPDTIKDMRIQGRTLSDVSAQITEINGVKGSNTATLDNIARVLEKMSSDEDEVARNLDSLKSYIGTLGTWLNSVRNQPLLLDYISIQPADTDLPRAEANFFEAAGFEIGSFIGSFFTDYSNLGATKELSDTEVINVWAQTDRDSAQVIRNLTDNNFTGTYDIGVNLRLVTAGTLLPATLSGTGPDVALENAQGIPVQYAIRNAVQPLDEYDTFDEIIYGIDNNGDGVVTEFTYKDENGKTVATNIESDITKPTGDVLPRFSESATVPMQLMDKYGVTRTYGLPETQTFQMMFYRKDVFAELGVDIPRTWDDLMSIVPVLQYNNMQVGIPGNYAGLQLFLYQMGGELYADNGMRINLDSNLALEAFDTMCSYFTQYSFPITYDPANRFRTGEMPLIFADYITMYNQLSVFATEIRDLWEFVPVIGMEDEDGNVNNTAISTVTTIIMMNGCTKQENAWKFMDWYTSEDTQESYANEKIAIVGPGSMFATANKEAIKSLPWTSQDLQNIEAQYNNLATIPEMPGGYIIARYVGFAFLDAYNNHADPVEGLLDYIDDINKEITRKRNEFELPTMESVKAAAEAETHEN